ncbi:acetyl-CoA synthetase-like protein [Mycena belliarum]|uniref:Acetyl-CoA synthetase-like protein n=1 Tax=Mycena belliarum TaxID=1033014 RepID=A0AAD6UE31_9AGAR|nr:acetyl-CoA synthetase-like protein [Mycena belliae]
MSHFMSWVLEGLSKYPSRPIFKRYIKPTAASNRPTWLSISYKTFLTDLEHCAAYWGQKLGDKGVNQKDVVGIWITGTEYTDLANLYGLARAGYIPEVLNAKMSVPVIRDLLVKSGGKAIVCDPNFAAFLTDFPLDTFAIPKLGSLSVPPSSLPALPAVTPDDIAMIFHTSGTTSGIPKPVPETHRWLKSQAQVQWPNLWQCYTDGRPLMVNNIGSFGNVGSATTMSYLSWSGHCLVQTSKPDFDVNEFLAMVNEEGLNCMILYAPWLSKLLKLARSDPVVLSALKGMGQIHYTGAALNPDDEAWAMDQDIPITSIYSTTECAACLVSPLGVKGVLSAMCMLEGINCKFIPVSGMDRTDLDGDSEKRSKGGQLFDLFVPAEADNCPHPSVRNRPDGHITGDLFEEAGPGLYYFRGRNDDWIRTGKHLVFCDTKSIEDNVLATCADLIHNTVVVGHYKPVIVLFVEPLQPITSLEEENTLKATILKRTGDFNSRLFVHEQINSPDQIFPLPIGSLSRTTEKGNIRRKAVEDEYAASLDEIYSKFRE